MAEKPQISINSQQPHAGGASATVGQLGGVQGSVQPTGSGGTNTTGSGSGKK